jgi:RNA polymerase sigma-70 factor (ECF subfamily)
MKGGQVPERADDELLGRISGGDEEALAALIQRLGTPVHSLALRILRDRGAAEEVFQDVFLKVWKEAGRFDPSRGKAASWILSMAHHRAIDLFRSRKIRGATLAGQPLERALGRSASAPALEPWQKLALERCLEAMPQPQRQALELAYFEGLSREEMSRRLGIPVGTAKSRIRLALRSLKRNFGSLDRDLWSKWRRST